MHLVACVIGPHAYIHPHYRRIPYGTPRCSPARINKQFLLFLISAALTGLLDGNTSTLRDASGSDRMKVYTAGLVFLTQQLAVSRNLLLRQKLTSAHDKTSAWNGLGSAVVAVWRQYSIPTAVSGTIAIATYLACISALHITTPAILRLVPFNSTRGISVGTSISVPNNSQYVPGRIVFTAPLAFTA